MLGACSSEPPLRSRPIAKEVVAYGGDPLQRGVLRTQVGIERQPVIVLIHGGYWRRGLDREAMEPLADDLSRRGWATWNLDYRRVGDDGGGWAGTLEDVARGIDFLDVLRPRFGLDLSKVAVIGHSAGAQLAFWAVGRGDPSAEDLGGGPVVQPAAAVSLSGVLDLETAAEGTRGDAAELATSTHALLGGTPEQVPDRYAAASPIELVPLAVPQLLLHGSGDTRVPPEQSRTYGAAAAEAGDPVELVELPDVNHFDVILLDHIWWGEVLRWLPAQLGSPP